MSDGYSLSMRRSALSQSVTRSRTVPSYSRSTDWVRRHGEDIVITHVGTAGPVEVARHQRTTPGQPHHLDEHFGPTPEGPLHRCARAGNHAEAAFLALGAGRSWLSAAGKPWPDPARRWPTRSRRDPSETRAFKKAQPAQNRGRGGLSSWPHNRRAEGHVGVVAATSKAPATTNLSTPRTTR